MKRKNGLKEFYDERGVLSMKIFYTNDKFDGVFKRFKEYGGLEIKSFYKNGLSHGVEEIHGICELIVSESLFRDSELDGIFEIFHRNGNLEMKSFYKNGLLHGVEEKYDYYGLIESKCSYKNGKLDGVSEIYHRIETSRSCLWDVRITENRNRPSLLSEKKTYVDGQHQGPYEIYYENGKLREKGFYKNGQIEEKEVFETGDEYDSLGGQLSQGRRNRGNLIKRNGNVGDDSLPF